MAAGRENLISVHCPLDGVRFNVASMPCFIESFGCASGGSPFGGLWYDCLRKTQSHTFSYGQHQSFLYEKPNK